MTETYGKRINKRQAEILDSLFHQFDEINEIANQYGEDFLDMTDASDTIIGLAEDLYLSFGNNRNKLFQGS